MVVRRRTIHLFVTTLDDQQVTVLDARDELYPFVAQVLVEVFYQYVALLGSEVPTMMVLDFAIFQGDDVATQCQVVRLHVVAYRGGLQRATPFIYLVQVITQDAGIGYLGTRTETFWHGEQSATTPFFRQEVHDRGMGILQQRLTTQSFYRVVSHAVT